MTSAETNPGIASALRTLRVLSDGLAALPGALEGPLGEAFVNAVEAIRAIDGRVIVTGCLVQRYPKELAEGKLTVARFSPALEGGAGLAGSLGQ